MQATSEQSFMQPEQMALPAPEAEEGSGATEQAPSVADVSKRCGGRRCKQGLDAAQPMLLPPSVEDHVSKDTPVRAIRACVDTLDSSAFDVQHAGGALSAGQPAHDPADLLALYLYGYLNRVRSSRRLQAECERNLELIRLLRGLRPGSHTIADFRKNNAAALTAINRDFVQPCREPGLFGGKPVGIDGRFFNGNASHASVKTDTQLKAELAAIERDIERCRRESEETDAAEASVADQERLTPEQPATLQARAERRREQIEQLDQAGETRLPRTDADARRLSRNGKKVTGCNVQRVVDDAHKLILAHDVANAGNDFGQPAPMSEQAKQVLGVEELEVVADAGCHTEADIARCEQQQTTVCVPIPAKVQADAEDRLPGRAFQYNAAVDVHTCPGGQTLSPSGKPQLKNGTRRQRCRSQAKRCAECPLRSACLPQKTPVRQIHRSEHADALERHRQRMAGATDKMRQRAALCEHPFGTMKRWLGWDHFLVRGFEKVRGEMALLVHCCNFKRALSIFGVERFIAICAARQHSAATASDEAAFFSPFPRPMAHLRRPWRRFSPDPSFSSLGCRTRRRRASARAARRQGPPCAAVVRL